MKEKIISLLISLILLNIIYAKERNSEIYYKKYLENPDNMENIKALAISYKNEKNYTKAIDFYRLCITKEGDNSYYYHQLALCHKLRGRPDIALEVVTNALHYFENNFKLKLLYADILLELGNISNAINTYESLLKSTQKKNDIAYIYGKLGKCYLYLNNSELSEKYLVESIKIKENEWSYYYLSKLYEEKDVEKALWAIKKAKSYCKNDEKDFFLNRFGYLLYKKGVALKDKGEKEKAKETFKEFISKAELKNTPYFEKVSYWMKRL
ncbi:MAG: tetratricopeptide repeat protein [Brevinematia bacterium]